MELENNSDSYVLFNDAVGLSCDVSVRRKPSVLMSVRINGKQRI